jgi:hypothetical protein
LTVCDFLPVRTVTVRPATSVLKPDGEMLTDEVLHLEHHGANPRQPLRCVTPSRTAARRSRSARSSWPFLRTAREPLDEIAAALGISRGAFKSHTARGMAALGAALER